MNIQQLAAEKAREKYPEVVFTQSIQHIKEYTLNDILKIKRDEYPSAWQDCLNHLAGSEGDVDKMVEEFASNIHYASNIDPHFTWEDKNRFIEAIQEHTATHCAKVLSQQWVSVDESKPEIESNYFNSPISITVLGITRESRFVVCFYDYKKEKWYADGVEIYVTHWQPLPTPPINQ